MRIEVWSDVVCPWCLIGKRRLDHALTQVDGLGDVEVVHRAFQLDPESTTMGQRTVDVLARKYQMSAEQTQQMMQNVTDVANEVGLQYDLANTLSGNTAIAHQLLLWAQSLGKGAQLLEAMYLSYFEQALPVFTLDDLLPLVTGIGLDGDAAAAAIANGSFAEQVAADQDLARQFGANGVPFYVIDRAFGISGAQSNEVFVSALIQARDADRS